MELYERIKELWDDSCDWCNLDAFIDEYMHRNFGVGNMVNELSYKSNDEEVITGQYYSLGYKLDNEAGRIEIVWEIQ